MKKLFALLLLIFAIIPLSLAGTGQFLVEKVKAKTNITSNLDYFALKEPVSVCKDSITAMVDGEEVTKDTIYIAQKDLIVIYHDETYDEIDCTGKNISHIEKTGNFLLFLSDNQLFSLNLVTKEINNVTCLNCDMNFDNVSSFTVSGNYFAVITAGESAERLITYFEITDNENFIFEKMEGPNSQAQEASTTMALTNHENVNDKSLFYYNSLTKAIIKFQRPSNAQQDYIRDIDNINQLIYVDKLYYKTENEVCVKDGDDAIAPSTVIKFADFNIENPGDIFISDGKMLICDTSNDRICEYDIDSKEMTGFEISFTKIFIPENFKPQFSNSPKYLDITAGSDLYHVNIEKSLSSDYFVFNGYYNQEKSADYLIIAEIDNLYYLIAGDCVALVVKSRYTPFDIQKTAVNEKGYITNNAKSYLLPCLDKEFTSFDLVKDEEITLLSTLNFRGVDYSIIKKGENTGYIPSSFVKKNIYTPPIINSFETATTVRRTSKVYEDKDFTKECDDLPSFSQVIISESFENGYKISYGENKTGFIKKESIAKKGSFTNKVVAVVIICALSFTITAIYLELKYLYSRDNLSKKNKDKKKEIRKL